MSGIAQLGIAQLGISRLGIARNGIVGRGGGWDPSQLDPEQWLYLFTSPATATDKSANLLDADYRESNCGVLDGVADTLDTGVKMVGGQPVNFETSFLYRVRASEDALFSSTTGAPASKGLLLRINNATTITAYSNDGTVAHTSVCTIPAIVDGTDYSIKFDWDGVSGAPTLTINGAVYIGSALTGWSGDSALNTWLYSQVNTHQWLAADVYFAKMDGYFHYVFADTGAGLNEADVSGNGNDGTWTVGAGGVATLRSGLQNVYHYNTAEGCSRYLVDSGTTEIAVTGLVGSETITNTGTSTVTAAAGKLEVGAGTVWTISIDGVVTYDMSTSFGTTIKAIGSTWPDGTLTGGIWGYTPADQSNPGYDTDGNVLTNPPVTGNGLLNNSEASIWQPDGEEATLGVSRLYYDVDGVTEIGADWGNMLEFVSYSDDYTWIKWDNSTGFCMPTDTVIATVADLQDYNNMLNWKGDAPCGSGTAPFSINLISEGGDQLIQEAGGDIHGE